jgi:hypothetical protein
MTDSNKQPNEILIAGCPYFGSESIGGGNKQNRVLCIRNLDSLSVFDKVNLKTTGSSVY